MRGESARLRDSLTQNRRLAGRPIQIADDHQTGGNPDPSLQGSGATSSDAAHRFDDAKPGSNRAFCLVLIRSWVAETGQRSIVQPSRNGAARLRNHPRATLAKLREQTMQVFRV